jgi:hypothetical protein
LLIFDEVAPDHPVAQRQADIDGPVGLCGKL